MSARWTIHQLVEMVRLALGRVGYDGQESKRVRDVPDKRTIRYYTTLGIVDRPVEFRARTAYYGPRHLLQLVAIKRLQAEGWSLLQVQKALAGADEARLMALAHLPNDFWQRLPDAVGDRAPQVNRVQVNEPDRAERTRFWAALPAVAKAGEEPGAGKAIFARPAVSFDVARGLRVVIDGLDPGRVTPEVLDELWAALAHVAKVLARLPPQDGAGQDGSVGGAESHAGWAEFAAQPDAALADGHCDSGMPAPDFSPNEDEAPK